MGVTIPVLEVRISVGLKAPELAVVHNIEAFGLLDKL